MLEAFAEAYADRFAAARAWKAGGGQVVGYLCDNVPDELISAAGFFPLRVSGAPDVGGERVRRQVDRLYTPDVTTRPAFATAILEQLLSGAYDLLDYLIVPHNRDAIQAIFRHLKDAHRADPALRLPVLHYLDKAWAPGAASEAYNRTAIAGLRATLESWAGRPVRDDALRDAIAVANENRRLLSRVAELRAARPPRLSGVEALQVIGASMVMPKADHNVLLRRLLASERPARQGPRLFVGGSPLDHTRVYEAIESCGATVVAEDHCWGNRAFELPVDPDADPLDALAARFHRRPACSIQFPIAEGRIACRARAAAANVDAAIFYVMADDWSQVWETPGQVKALETVGIPTLVLLRQSYELPDPEPLKAEVSAFLAGRNA